ncbi:MAG: TrbG/VirB9 family P-type conjugative transfer protein [Thiothrix sp.]|nr:TrbG/VirB9 family P-type conjugative transfer protein [Thiothrix sp.]
MTVFKMLLGFFLVLAGSTGMAAEIFQPAEPVLSRQDTYAAKLSQQAADENRYPVQDGDKTLYLYGSGQPVLICAPLKVCLVELAAGEKVVPNGIHLGDSVRWRVSPAVGDSDKTFLVVKAVAPGLETNLAVITDRHSYDIRLVSKPAVRISKIAWNYPQDTAAAWADYHARQQADKAAAEARAQQAQAQARQAQQQAQQRARQAQQQQQAQKAQQQQQARQAAIQQREAQTIPETGDVLTDLDFAYGVAGCDRCDWRPVRVYNNKKQTVIQMPDMAGKELPALLVTSFQGPGLVNYRFIDNRFIVDRVFQQAVLVIGVGDNQQKVIISRGGV